MTHRGAGFALALFCMLAACGDDDPVPVDEIPPESKLADLDDAEVRGLCEWGAKLSKEKLAGASCAGTAIGFSGCMKVPADCQATVAQWRACMPAFFDRIAANPCELLNISTSLQSVISYIDETPHCATIGECATFKM